MRGTRSCHPGVAERLERARRPEERHAAAERKHDDVRHVVVELLPQLERDRGRPGQAQRVPEVRRVDHATLDGTGGCVGCGGPQAFDRDDRRAVRGDLGQLPRRRGGRDVDLAADSGTCRVRGEGRSRVAGRILADALDAAAA